MTTVLQTMATGQRASTRGQTLVPKIVCPLIEKPEHESERKQLIKLLDRGIFRILSQHTTAALPPSKYWCPMVRTVNSQKVIVHPFPRKHKSPRRSLHALRHCIDTASTMLQWHSHSKLKGHRHRSSMPIPPEPQQQGQHQDRVQLHCDSGHSDDDRRDRHLPPECCSTSALSTASPNSSG